MFERMDFRHPAELRNYAIYDPNAKFEELEFDLIEDMFLAAYLIGDDKYVIDIGWYPEGDEKGEYKIQFVNDDDWGHPIYVRRTRDFEKLREYLVECLDKVDKLREAEI